MSSTFGRIFRITTFGESHGPAVGVVVDGCPPRLGLAEADIQAQLDRRRPGQGTLATTRNEPDRVEILSGVQDGLTLGTPLALLVRNRDQRPADYREFADVPRPSHADFTYREKYGLALPSGGGRASARETVARVAAGAVAEKWLKQEFGVEIVAWVDSAAGITADGVDSGTVTRQQVDAQEIRCPDRKAAGAMAAAVAAARDEGDSVGGTISCACRGVPAGWGEPVFDKLEALLAQAMLSIPAAKGFESGSGFAGAGRRGSGNNDLFRAAGSTLATVTNHSGGIQGGISNGQPVIFRVAFKPPSTIGKPQRTAAYDGSTITLQGTGRHDPCVLPRAVPVIEAMAALVLADAALLQRTRT